MTPNDIEVLIHCHVSPTPHPRLNAMAVSSAIASFMQNGLIERYDEADTYQTTERGQAHIRQLCNTPWPVNSWSDEHGRIIDLTS